ncbi:MAG: hypothetical protein KDD60_06915 [Bdellovibrionales bacterium]|nr:hypothetical protein [Bdellovibrionales bacterium]
MKNWRYEIPFAFSSRSLWRKSAHILLPGLLFTLLASPLVGCSSSKLAVRKISPLENTQVATNSQVTRWAPISPQQPDTLRKKFQLNGESREVFTLQLESCGHREQGFETANLVRQLFIGFDGVKIHSPPHPEWLPEETSLSSVNAKLEGSPFQAIVFSWRKETCLYEQVFWVQEDDMRWMNRDSSLTMLFNELPGLKEPLYR